MNNKSLGLSIEEKAAIDRIYTHVKNNGNYRTTDLWSCFSSPQKIKKIHISKNNQINLTFSEDEVTHLKSAKEKLTKYLSEKCKNRCAYCKRPMGNYGWSWQIEHIKCKSHHRGLIFDLSNLTLACVDCNYRKASSIDRQNKSSLIINPNEDDFKYHNHLAMELYANEDLILLCYEKKSDLGISTYDKLKFENLEFSSALRSIDIKLDLLVDKIDSFLTSTAEDENDKMRIKLLSELKDNILNRT